MIAHIEKAPQGIRSDGIDGRGRRSDGVSRNWTDCPIRLVDDESLNADHSARWNPWLVQGLLTHHSPVGRRSPSEIWRYEPRHWGQDATCQARANEGVSLHIVDIVADGTATVV